MTEIVYAKGALERNSKYRLITIIEDSAGIKRVQKKAACDDAIEHVNRMFAYSQEKLFDNEHIHLAPCHKIANGQIEFDFVDGRSLTSIMEGHLLGDDWEGFLSDVSLLKETIYDALDQQAFVMTEEFREIFGDLEEKGQVATRNINIDLIPDNIIMSDSEKYIIDYEWIMPFPVPLEYVMYRAVMYCPNNLLTEERKGELFQFVGIDSEMQRVYGEMEKHFQEYVAKYSLTNLYTKGGCVAHYINYHTMDDQVAHIRVYDETGDLLYQRESIMGENEISISVEKTNHIILSPYQGSCIVKILSCVKDGRSVCFSECMQGADYVMGDDYYFGEKSEILIDVEDCSNIKIKFSLLIKNSSLISPVARMYGELEGKQRDEAAQNAENIHRYCKERGIKDYIKGLLRNK